MLIYTVVYCVYYCIIHIHCLIFFVCSNTTLSLDSKAMAILGVPHREKNKKNPTLDIIKGAFRLVPHQIKKKKKKEKRKKPQTRHL
jgi:hypothetical protein